MIKQECLFSEIDWRSVEGHKRKELEIGVNAIDENQLLNTSVYTMCADLVERFKIDVPVLKSDRKSISEPRETKVDVSKDKMRAIIDPSEPFYVPGTEIEITVPFTGDPDVFRFRYATYQIESAPPRAIVKGMTITFTIIGVDLAVENVRRIINNNLDRINGHLTRFRGKADVFHNKLNSVACQAIEQRRKRLLANHNLIASLGIPINSPKHPPKTYQAPEVHRRNSPALFHAGSPPDKPEPVLVEEHYLHILEVIKNMGQEMEHDPSTFSTMDEESLRSNFLVQLNGHYPGQATGETFNCKGKTDILIRSEGRNIFIAECKYWNGPRSLTKAIDQILSYSSWRDTKVAVIIFNRNKDFSNVLNEIKSTTKDHPNYKRELDTQSESSFRCIFSHIDDQNRELTLTVMAFDIPK